MEVEMIFGMVIFCIPAMITVVVGIFNIKDKHPCGFYTGEKKMYDSEISNIKAYNTGHGVGWILYGIGMLLAGSIGFWPVGSLIYVSAIFIEILGGLAAMIYNHHRLLLKYKTDNLQKQ